MSGRAYVFDINDRLWHDFALYAKVKVVNVGITHTLRKNDSSQDGLVWVARIPTFDVAVVLGLRRRSHVSRVRARPSKGWGLSDILDVSSTHQSSRSVNHVGSSRLLRTSCDSVERVIREIPARVRERIVESPLVSYTETATQRCFAIAEYIISKANTRTEVIVVALTKAGGWRETT